MKGKFGKGGSAPSQETAADAGTQSGAQGQAAEAVRWQVQATSRWEALCTGRIGGEQVKRERASGMNGYGCERGRKEGETNNPENGRIKRWSGRA